MKRIALAVAAPVLLLGLAGCGNLPGIGGGLSEDEQTVADNLATSLIGDTDTEQSEAYGRCAGEAIVESVGIETLQEDGLVDDDLEVLEPDADTQISERTATGIADAIVDCNDLDAQGETLKENENVQASEEQIDEYISCMKGIDEDDYKQLVIRQISNLQHGDEEAAGRSEEEVTECNAIILPEPEGIPGGGAPDSGEGEDAPGDE